MIVSYSFTAFLQVSVSTVQPVTLSAPSVVMYCKAAVHRPPKDCSSCVGEITGACLECYVGQPYSERKLLF